MANQKRHMNGLIDPVQLAKLSKQNNELASQNALLATQVRKFERRSQEYLEIIADKDAEITSLKEKAEFISLITRQKKMLQTFTEQFHECSIGSRALKTEDPNATPRPVNLNGQISPKSSPDSEDSPTEHVLVRIQRLHSTPHPVFTYSKALKKKQTIKKSSCTTIIEEGEEDDDRFIEIEDNCSVHSVPESNEEIVQSKTIADVSTEVDKSELSDMTPRPSTRHHLMNTKWPKDETIEPLTARPARRSSIVSYALPPLNLKLRKGMMFTSGNESICSKIPTSATKKK